MVLSIVDTVLSPINPLTDTVPHQVIPQYENVDIITPTTEHMCCIWCDIILIVYGTVDINYII